MYSTSICGSIVTPACWARSRSWRRVGSSVAPARVVEDQRRSASRSIVIGSRARSRLGRHVQQLLAHRGPDVEPAVVDRERHEPGLELSLADRVGDLGGVLADHAHAHRGMPRAELLRRGRRAGSGARCRTCRRRPCRRVTSRTSRTDSAASRAAASVRSACGRSSRPASVSSSPRPGAREQRHAELGLEPADLLGQARLGHVQRLRGGARTSRARRRRGST